MTRLPLRCSCHTDPPPLSAPPAAVYLGVTNLSAYQVRMTGLCAQWQPQRHAGAYRVVAESLLSEYTSSSTFSPEQTERRARCSRSSRDAPDLSVLFVFPCRGSEAGDEAERRSRPTLFQQPEAQHAVQDQRVRSAAGRDRRPAGRRHREDTSVHALVT